MDNKNIIESFSRQSSQFNENKILSDKRWLREIVDDAEVREGEWVLDLGCGTGLLTSEISKKTSRAVGVDLTKDMLAQAVKRNVQDHSSILYILGDAQKLPFFSEQFDTVMTRLTIHHFPEPKLILNEISRVLKANGKLVIADIISSENKEKQRKQNELETLRDPSHYKFLSESELHDLIAVGGFSIEKTNKWTTRREVYEWLSVMDNNKESEIIKLLEDDVHNDRLGIQVAKINGELIFNHNWVCITAKKKNPT